jgi:hypothetical protein
MAMVILAVYDERFYGFFLRLGRGGVDRKEY